MKLRRIEKKELIYSSIAFLILGVMFLAYYIIYRSTHVATDDAYIDGRIHSVAPKIYGTVKRVNVTDNQDVKKGGVIVEIDPVDYELKVHEAQADLDSKKAELLDAEAGIKAAAANLELQEASLNQATLDKKRAEALYKDGVIPKEQHEKMDTAFDIAAAQVKAAREQLEKAKSQKNLAEAAIKQKQAVLDIANLNLSYTRICAPSDGYVTNKSVEAGNQIQVAQPIMAVVDLNDIWLVANYKETQLKNVRRGQKVTIKVDTYPGRIFTGKVDSIMAGTGAAFSLFPPENALGNYVKVVQRIPVKIVFDKSTDDRHVLRIGMSCEPTIVTNDK